MTVEEHLDETKEILNEKKEPASTRRYDIYDKNVYLNKRESHLFTIGYLREKQSELNIDLPNDLLTMMFNFCYNDKIKELMKNGQTELFIEKLHLCETILDFTLENMEPTYENAKQTKTNLLNDIIEFIASKTWLSNDTLPILSKLMNMISINLFRSLPNYTSPYINSLSFINDDEKDLSNIDYSDPQWIHLAIVYDILWRLINTPEFTPKMIEKHLNKSFLTNLIQLFNSRDMQERKFLMMILHTIYGRCMNLRPIIVEIISNYLYETVLNNDREINYFGINELLLILNPIISGINIPIKETWKHLFINVLIPLYKSYALKIFWEPLTQLIETYISQDINLANIILYKLLKYWPIQSPQKEEIFLMVCLTIINALITNNNFIYENHKNIIIKMMNKLTKCMRSEKQPVSERAINIFNERSIQRLIDYDRKSLLNIVFIGFYKCKNKYFNNIKIKKLLKRVEGNYKSLDNKFWTHMQIYCKKKDKKEREIKDNIYELEMKGIEPWINIKKKIDIKYNKPKYKHKLPQLTNAEKTVRRKYNWERIKQKAETNKMKFICCDQS